MELHDADEVMQVFVVKDVNEALDKGWRVVAVVSAAMPGSGEGGPVPCFVLGRKKPNPQMKISEETMAKAREKPSR